MDGTLGATLFRKFCERYGERDCRDCKTFSATICADINVQLQFLFNTNAENLEERSEQAFDSGRISKEVTHALVAW
ncbi:hypothetical protein F444_20724 [Phytophthora nicotianae P1976]|uniref:Uncharacterized protein n=1 Tax=Phytophthora nicotianae P1976 TaxID=1317066 RepID=A0A080Z3N3_PHYNI|nr:hypothetical protein F444_20724 [Phytophthora nicotianae P1976]